MRTSMRNAFHHGRRLLAAAPSDVVRPGPRRALAGALALVLVAGTLGACGERAEAVTGVVVALDTTGGTVRGFTLRATDGAILTFTIGDLQVDGAAFPASHLVVHAVTSSPIAVAYRVVDGRNVVYRMTDAPGSSTSPSSGAATPSPAPAGTSPSAAASP